MFAGLVLGVFLIFLDLFLLNHRLGWAFFDAKHHDVTVVCRG